MTAETDLTGLVVRTAHRVTVDDVSPSVLHGLKLSILDLLACCVAGSRTQGSVARGRLGAVPRGRATTR